MNTNTPIACDMYAIEPEEGPVWLSISGKEGVQDYLKKPLFL